MSDIESTQIAYFTQPTQSNVRRQLPEGMHGSTAAGVAAEAAPARRLPLAPLVDTQKLRPPYSPNGSQPLKRFQTYDQNTGEVFDFETSGKPGVFTPKYSITDHQNTRAERWSMKWALIHCCLVPVNTSATATKFPAEILS